MTTERLLNEIIHLIDPDGAAEVEKALARPLPDEVYTSGPSLIRKQNQKGSGD